MRSTTSMILSLFLARMMVATAFSPSSYHSANSKSLLPSLIGNAGRYVKYMASNDLPSTQQFTYDDNDDDDEEEDTEDFMNSLTLQEKKQMAKEFFSRILDYDEEMRPEFVHIILFSVGTSREGAHSIEFPQGSGNNVLLAFEDELECGEFIEGLKEQDFFDPVQRKIKLDNLEAYCKDIRVGVQVIPSGTHMKPPQARTLNLGLNPDLEKEMKLLENLFQMDSNEGDTSGAWE